MKDKKYIEIEIGPNLYMLLNGLSSSKEINDAIKSIFENLDKLNNGQESSGSEDTNR